MNSSVLYFISHFIPIFPETRFFGFKRILYRLAGIKIGKNVRICSSVRFWGCGKLEIGDNTWIGHDTLIISSSYIKIGNNVDIAPKVYIGTGSHIIDPTGIRSAGEGYSKDIIIEDGVWLCAGVAILPNVIIGRKCVIAAGAIVVNNTEESFIYGGMPAKKIKKIQ